MIVNVKHIIAGKSSSAMEINPKNGYCQRTNIYHSLRPAVPLPLPGQPESIVSYSLSLLHSIDNPTSAALSTTEFLIDAATGRRVTYSSFIRQVASLSSSIRSIVSRKDVAFILSPPSLQIPVLYFALLSIGAIVSPSNPMSTPAEIAHQIQLCRPAVAFCTSDVAHKLPPDLPVILIDTPRFRSMLDSSVSPNRNDVVVKQSDTAAILYSSGTTGKVKGVILSHRNFIAIIGDYYHNRLSDEDKAELEGQGHAHTITLLTTPLFHVFGFFMLFRAAALGEGVVLMERFDFVKLLEAVEKYRVNYIPVTPPLIVALSKFDFVSKYDLSSLRVLASGGAPLGKEVAEQFRAKFPDVHILPGYGMTETAGGATGTLGLEESTHYGSAGRLSATMEAKIVNPETGESLPPGERGELWLRGPAITKGYVGDDAATSSTFDTEGWLKTGDLCYFDSDGYLFVVDRLKELIKYKAYQVPPVELENLLMSMTEIGDAAVVPYPDEEAGEIPMAFVVRKPGSSISAAEIMDSIAKQVSPYKKIRRVAFVNSIPKTPAGKILRRELVKQAIASAASKL